MTSDLQDLYQDLIIDHSKRPRNFGPMENPDYTADGFNPLCGDKLKLFLKVEDGVIKDVKFVGAGCAISTASASVMTDVLKGQTVTQAENLFETFHYMITGPKDPQHHAGEGLGKLAVFAGVSEFPARVKCATLAWHTLKSALAGSHDATSTE
ncbi:MAG: SUF system NifU family Fe-S cluster assembly protein [Acidobacteria bacterium]|nr:SUF system NifU family Fe-S cluster assembly protein [Acidobacteriota bacterium]